MRVLCLVLVLLKKSVNSWYEQYSKDDLSREKLNIRCTLTGSSFDPGDVETASDEGVGVGHLLDHLAGGLSGAVARLCVH